MKQGRICIMYVIHINCINFLTEISGSTRTVLLFTTSGFKLVLAVSLGMMCFGKAATNVTEFFSS